LGDRKDTGLAVATASSADEALPFLAVTVPALVFCDISMPDRSGLELLQEVRRKGYHCAVIMLTAHSEKERILEALRLGAVDYITKPFNTAALLSALPTWIEMGKRLQRLAEPGERTGNELRMMELIRVKINNDKKKLG
jgi:DNA-binding response OmpR family regulator